ncbi:patatin-like phospholipase family protein [Anaerosporobacter faecicola]|uniref:patatin-like phospholipase family protein n=1 Tax=Anaerosporobacter faecicola TaxID=2718714 RepID=UPI00143995F4|nr:patatin family protein [Anaerosporobacter faecicola]
MKERTALVLEGGSLRCLFTSGVLDTFMSKGIEFPCVAGVSAGSLSGLNYVSKQIGRTAKVNINYVNDKRYLGIHSLIHNHSIFNFDFLFDDIGKELLPFDVEAFERSTQRFVAFATDCSSGKLVPFEKGKTKDILLGCRSSCSMPLLSPIVQVEGLNCLDGGIANPIPIEWAIEQGYEKIVVVLTRQQGYRKQPVSKPMLHAYERAYRKYPHLINRLKQIPAHYNELQEKVDQWENEGRIFVIRPEEPVLVSRVEKNVDKLRDLYEIGKQIANKRLDAMQEYIES